MVRYRKLGRVELNVTQLQTARRFYEEIVGLQYVDTAADGGIRLRCDQDHHNVVLYEAREAGLRCAGFMLEDAAQFAPLIERLASAGLTVHEIDERTCRARAQSRAIRVFEPLVGATVEFYVPSADSARPFQASVTRIQRLGHVVFNTPDAARAVEFWRDVLNFRESDSVGEFITFMRCWPSPWHHGIGIAQYERRSLHHVNYMVTEIDDIGRALTRLKNAGSDIVFGPGRHPASDSVFLYFLDPDGLTMEYSFGMEAFPEAFPRAPRRIEPSPVSLDYWGSTRDPRCFTGAGANAAPEFNLERVGEKA
ncbi:2,3-dihydroxy-p-cumate/2,3-dihydroxybenzoate 3,4-dioxygenase [Paraburkholderia sp. GAS199]|uniref:VOC family protein n=1 Tax=Paraburkholderia sp. GAS199 TaxID=3035126 RepID=UPI003D1EC318